MAKTIQTQIAELENRCAKLVELQKLFEKAVKNEFGIETKKIHKILENSNSNTTDFEKKIATHFGLKTKEDYADFLNVFCTESSMDYFIKKRSEKEEV